MRIAVVMRKCINMPKKMIQKTLLKIKLREMDDKWRLMGGSCWGLFPPSFYYTHTEKEVERITNETMERIKKMIEDI